MDVVSLCPLRVGSMVWQPRRGAWVLTAVCKATFTLTPGESQLAEEQEYPNEDDNHWNDDPARSVYSPADLVPFKPRADVLLVGHAFAGRKEGVKSLVARLVVGEVNKAVEVWCDRSWTQDGSLREGPRFLKMPLRFERAAGGPDTANPVGVRLDARADAYGSQPLPNLQPPGLTLASARDHVEPICFGPLAWSWPGRRERLARHAATWSPASLAAQPLPDDIDPGFFNAAPRDQQTDALRPNERIVLENLHPEHPRLATSLPGKTPRAFVERRGVPAQEVQLICDTLWIDSDRGICTLTWRAQISLDSPTQPGRVLIALAEPGQRLTWADVERQAASIKPSDADAEPRTPPRPKAEPVAAIPPPEPPRAQRPSPALPALPFVASAPEVSASVPEAPKPRPSRPRGDPLGQTHDEVITPGGPLAGAALPFGMAATPPGSPRRTPPETPSAGGGPPPWLTQSRASAPPAPLPIPGTPFAGAPAAAPTFGPPPIQAPSAPTFSAPAFDGGPSNTGAFRVVPPPAPSFDGGPSNTGAFRAVPPPAPSFDGGPSNTGAFRAVPPPAPPPPTPSFDGGPSNTGAFRAVPPLPAPSSSGPIAPLPLPQAPPPAMAAVAIALPQAPVGAWAREAVELLWFDPAALPRIRAHEAWRRLLGAAEAPELRDRRDVSAVLARGVAIDPEGVGDAIADAVGEDGWFLAPLVLTAGELTFSFDEQATLAHRQYQKRVVLGATWLRATLATGGGSVPVYLPEALEKRLPLFQRFRVRVLAVAHLQQDQSETSATALEAVAIARVMPLAGGRSERRG
jgi:hypothetical protein